MRLTWYVESVGEVIQEYQLEQAMKTSRQRPNHCRIRLGLVVSKPDP